MQGGTKSFGPGFVRADYMGERRLSRFTYDDATKTLVARLGEGHPALDDAGLQLLPPRRLDGLRLQGQPVLRHRRQHGQHPERATTPATPTPPAVHDPVPRHGARASYVGDGLRHDAAVRRHRAPAGSRRCGHISYADARQTSGNTNAFEGKLLRIKPLAEPGRHAWHRDDVHDPGRRRAQRAEPVPADSQAVLDGKAKPEVFAMGTRNLYSIDIDPKTDKVATAWVGPDQGADSTTWGPAKTENAAIMGAAGNYGWPYCQGGNRHRLPRQAAGGDRGASRRTSPTTCAARSAAATDGQTGAFWDCSKRRRQRLAVQHRPDDDPGAEADEHLVRRAGRLLRLPAQRQRRPDLQQQQHDRPRRPRTASARSSSAAARRR